MAVSGPGALHWARLLWEVCFWWSSLHPRSPVPLVSPLLRSFVCSPVWLPNGPGSKISPTPTPLPRECSWVLYSGSTGWFLSSSSAHLLKRLVRPSALWISRAGVIHQSERRGYIAASLWFLGFEVRTLPSTPKRLFIWGTWRSSKYLSNILWRNPQNSSLVISILSTLSYPWCQGGTFQVLELVLRYFLWKFKFFFFFSIYLLAVLRGTWDLSSLTRDQTHAPCIGNAES